MKGDFSRLTFDAKRHFTGVRLQQGRVTQEADWNEAHDIVTHRLDRTFRDVIGDAAGPVDPDSFKVSIAANKIVVSPGRYYVGGRLLENDAPVTLPAQPHLGGGYCVLGTADPAFGVATLSAGEYAVLLDSWVRHVTVLEMPALLEPALGGVTTATRLQSVWQLKLMKLPNGTACGGVQATPAWLANAGPVTARMEAGTDTPAPAADKCDLSPSGGYQGYENDLYRVEIHKPGVPGTATFKWAIDNASFAAIATSWDNASTLTIASAPGDLTRGFQIGDTVELIDVETELRELPGTMLVILDIVGDTMIFTTPHGLGAAASGPAAAARKLRVRRWVGPVIVPKNGAWTPLGTDGVQVRFDKNGVYKTGQDWAFPARTATNDIEWPGGYQPPENLPHILTALARIKVDSSGNITVLGDCRTLFPPLSAMISLLFVAGDGQVVEPNEAGNAAPLPLAQPIVAAVMRGKLAVPGATVEFHIVTGANGKLNGLSSPQKVITGPDGLAICNWSLDPGVADASQQVEARMLDDGNSGFGNPVRFAARVFPLVEMKLAGGDTQTQINPPGGTAPIELKDPLSVVVTRANLAAANRPVRFTLIGVGGGSLSPTGGGAPSGNSQIDVLTDAHGKAACYWTLIPGEPPQHVIAELMTSTGTPWGQPNVIFSGGLIDLPPPGGSCCVTVGERGQFHKLHEAVTRLLAEDVRDICLCLMSGDHVLDEPIVIRGGRAIHLMIHGCGPATRLHLLSHSITAVGIGTLEFDNLTLIASDDPVRALNLGTACLRRVTGVSLDAILEARECDSVVIEECDLRHPDWRDPGAPPPPPPPVPPPGGTATPTPPAGGAAHRSTTTIPGITEGLILAPIHDLGILAFQLDRNLILIDDFEGNIRIVGNRLYGNVNVGGQSQSGVSFTTYAGLFATDKIKPVLQSGGLLTIVDNLMYEFRVTGEPERLLGLNESQPHNTGALKIPRVTRLQQNEIWGERSVLPGFRIFVETNRFQYEEKGVELLLALAPRGSDSDPAVKVVANSGPARGQIVSTAFVDKAVNAPLLIV